MYPNKASSRFSNKPSLLETLEKNNIDPIYFRARITAAKLSWVQKKKSACALHNIDGFAVQF